MDREKEILERLDRIEARFRIDVDQAVRDGMRAYQAIIDERASKARDTAEIPQSLRSERSSFASRLLAWLKSLPFRFC